MVTSFPAPVLSVTPDAVRDLEGREALSRLWTLFTKCKESIQDGRRLENISWRLWYRDMMLSNPSLEHGNFSDSDKFAEEYPVLDEKAYFPPTPVEPLPSVREPDQTAIVVSQPPAHSQDRASPLSQASSVAAGRGKPSSDHVRRGSFLNGTRPMSVGRIICDILPNSNSPSPSATGRLLGPTLSLSSMSSTTSLSESNSTRSPRSLTRVGSATDSTSLHEPGYNTEFGLRPIGANNHLLPILPLLPIPEPIIGGAASASQLPTPAAENEECLYDGLVSHLSTPQSQHSSLAMSSSSSATLLASNQAHSHAFTGVPDSASPSVSASTSFSRLEGTCPNNRHEKSVASSFTMTPGLQSEPSSASPSAAPLISQITCPAAVGPPSPSLSDSYARAHPGEVTDANQRITLGLPETQSQKFPPSISPKPSDIGASSSSSLPHPGPSVSVELNVDESSGSDSAVPQLSVVSTTSSPPRLVVVNPTPGPTPHTTPPATPLLGGASDGGKYRSHGQYLTAPRGRIPSNQLAPLPPPMFEDGEEECVTYSSASDLGNVTNKGLSDPAPLDLRLLNQDAKEKNEVNVNSSRLGDLHVDVSAARSRSMLEVSDGSIGAAPARAGLGKSDVSAKPLSSLSHSQPTVAASCNDSSDALVPAPPVQSSPSAQDPESLTKEPQQPNPNGCPCQPATATPRHPHRTSLSSTTTATSGSEVSSQLSLAATSVTCTSDDLSFPLATGVGPVAKDGPNGARLPQGLTMTPTISNSTVLSASPVQQPDPAPHVPLNSQPTNAHGGTSASVTSVTSVKSSRSAVSATTSSSRGAGSTSTSKQVGVTAAGGALRRANSSGPSGIRSRTGSSRAAASRSRSREAAKGVAAAAGALAATMGMTMTGAGAPSGRKRLGGKRVTLARTASGKGKALLGGAALTRTLSHEEVEEVSDEDGEGEMASPIIEHGQEVAKDDQRDAERAEKERQMEVEKEKARLAEQERLRVFAVREHQYQLEREMERKKLREAGSISVKPKFNIGSNSDDGSNVASKSAGSGSEFSAVAGGNQNQNMVGLNSMVLRMDGVNGVGVGAVPGQGAEAILERQGPADATQKEDERLKAEAIALARAKESLAAPLLPQAKRTIVLATSESDYTDTDEETWTSEDVDEEEVPPPPPPPPPPPRQRSHPEFRRAQPSHHAQPAHHVQPLHHAQPPHHAQQLPHPVQPSHHAQLPHHAPTHQAQPPQHPPQPPPPPPPQRPTGLHRTHSSTSGRRSQQFVQQRREAQLLVKRAAAQLQREEEERQMFAKRPTTSFQSLNEASRARSSGLLTQLMNPDPSIFPPSHPYRRGYSSGELPRTNFGPLTPLTNDPRQGQPTQVQREAPQPQPQPQRTQEYLPPPQQRPAPPQVPTQAPAERRPSPQDSRQPSRQLSQTSVVPPVQPRPEGRHQRQRSQPQPLTRAPGPAMAPRGMRGLGLQMSKSSAALPVSSSVQVGSVNPNAMAPVAGPSVVAAPPPVTTTTTTVAQVSSGGGYRPRGPPQGQELEDTDTEDEGESGIDLSRSVAQERLRVFAARRGIVTQNRPAAPTTTQGGHQQDQDGIPPWAREPPVQVRQAAAAAPPAQNPHALPVNAGAVHVSRPNPPVPAPIPVGHPYNLPLPAPPSTPRTTRRVMLRNEMSESLRRQLLWERQQGVAPIRRTASGGGAGRNNVLTGLRPLTTTPSMVQLHARGTTNRSESNHNDNVNGGNGDPRGSGERERRASNGHDSQEAEMQERRRRAMARNRSWANDYHTSGW